LRGSSRSPDLVVTTTGKGVYPTGLLTCPSKKCVLSKKREKKKRVQDRTLKKVHV
jgi:hypothetical protein